MSRYELFDRSRLEIRPLAERTHDLQADRWLTLDDHAPAFEHPDLPAVAARLKAARESGAARILMMGAHVLRSGVNRHIIDLLERGVIDHIAMNGAGVFRCDRSPTVHSRPAILISARSSRWCGRFRKRSSIPISDRISIVEG